MSKIEKTTRPPKKGVDQRIKNGGARLGSGRKPFEPTEIDRRQVEAMAGYGVPFEQISVLVQDGISIDTLRTHFSNELVKGKAKANAQIGKGIYQKALSGDTTAQIWWSKCQMGWKEPPRQLEHTGKDGGAISVSSVDLKGLNDTELAQMQALLQKANGGEA